MSVLDLLHVTLFTTGIFLGICIGITVVKWDIL